MIMTIRKARLNDASGIARVQVDSWRSTYRGIVPDHYLDGMSYQQREEMWRGMLKLAGVRPVYVAEEREGIVGFAAGGRERTNHPEYQGELYAIYLLKSHQRQGIGGQLVHSIATELQGAHVHSMLIWVLADNPSRRFYEALGGVPVQQQPIDIGGTTLTEIAYGWRNLGLLTKR